MKNRFILSPQFIGTPVPYLRTLAGDGWTINDPPLAGSDPQERMIAIHEPLARFVAETAAGGDRPVSVASDCCSSLGVLAGLQRAGVAPTLLWFDAHGDFNTPETTPSGFLGGMPLAMLVGRGDPTMPRALGLRPLAEEDAVLVDARDLDPGEEEAVRASRLTHVERAGRLLSLALPAGPLWVHFDTDILDSAEAPAQNYPVAGGPTAADLAPVFQRLAATGRLAAVSMSTWNPDLDEGRETERVCMGLLERLVG